MSFKKTLTTQGMTLPHIIFVVLNLIGIGVTVYLTQHYFNIHYPSADFTGSSGCNFNSFFNCDAATYSPIAAIAGVPLAILGLAVHVIFLVGSLIGKESFESTNKTISLINAIGCLVLFVYSLVVLGTLCPYCSVYYVISWIIFYLFWKKSDLPFMKINLVPLALAGLITAAFAGISFNKITTKKKEQASISSSIIKQYFELPDLGKPEYISPMTIAKSFENIDDAPIWILKFSDFQCPACKMASEKLEEFAKRYKGKINIYYYPLPLSNICNSNIKGAFHKHACQAAYLAACNVDSFHEVHDEIFKDQTKINDELLSTIKSKYKLENCETDEIKEIVKNTLDQGYRYKAKSTPTIILNGKKIPWSLPNTQFYQLFDEILRRKK